MNAVIRNALTILGSFIVGIAANILLIMIGSAALPTPDGIDPMTVEGMEKIGEMGAKYFIFPFIAHAAGSFAAAFVIGRFAGSMHLTLALSLGVVFLIFGIANVILIPAPTWFNVLDLVVAYIPMAYLGYLASGREQKFATA